MTSQAVALWVFGRQIPVEVRASFDDNPSAPPSLVFVSLQLFSGTNACLFSSALKIVSPKKVPFLFVFSWCSRSWHYVRHAHLDHPNTSSQKS